MAKLEFIAWIISDSPNIALQFVSAFLSDDWVLMIFLVLLFFKYSFSSVSFLGFGVQCLHVGI